jgi:DMSO/TMAO reductase YedYZ molybdopterin-dependent catalytic subunit
VALVALGMNGQALPLAHGYPARLLVAGLYGYASATKWLSEIELTAGPAESFWVERGWAREGPIRLESRIDTVNVGPPGGPGSGAPGSAARPVTLAGVAWAPPTGVASVEVQLDRGEWRTAELGVVPSTNTWVQWRYQWPDALPGDHLAAVRAIDRRGSVQTDRPSTPEPSGATGYHYWGFTV